MFDYLDNSYLADITDAVRHQEPNREKFPKYKEGDIIDEEQSVRWNREEVARRIQLYNDEVNRLENIRKQKISEVNEGAIDAIAVELLHRMIVLEEAEAEKKARKLFTYANTLRHREHENAVYLIEQINRLVEFVEMWEGNNYDE